VQRTASIIRPLSWPATWLVAAILVGPPCAALAGETRASCELTAAESEWVQEVLDGWEWVLAELLRREPGLPRMVLFDADCVWQLGAGADGDAGLEPIASSLSFAGAPVAVGGSGHEGTITLPSGKEIPAAPMATGFVYQQGGEATPFFVLAMVDLWREQVDVAKEPHMEPFFLGVALHEMVHTLQIVALRREITELGGRHDLPPQLDDDVIQTRFGDVPGFREALEAERDLLYRAALAEDEWASKVLAEQAIVLVRTRRERFFHGDQSFYARLEDVFLNLEGLAVWAHYRVALHDRDVAFQPDVRSPDPRTLIEKVWRKSGYWSQDEGFALVLLLERFVPHWQEEMLGPELPSPLELLARELARPAAP
jgi:hypothetical protein